MTPNSSKWSIKYKVNLVHTIQLDVACVFLFAILPLPLFFNNAGRGIYHIGALFLKIELIQRFAQ